VQQITHFLENTHPWSILQSSPNYKSFPSGFARRR